MKQYNIYFGTIGKTLACKYRFTKWCKTDLEALEIAENAAKSLYYENEGKFGITPFSKISKESKITGVDIETLYQEHIKDMCRWYVIPTTIDTVPSKKLKF